MDTLHLVDLKITLVPIFYRDPPEIKVGVNGWLSPHELTKPTSFEFKFYSRASSCVQVEFCNKWSNDTVPELGLDKAVVVESVSFFGVEDARFAWAGVYQPKDMDPLNGQTYLSWNGIWTLAFDVPVFSWMHKTQGLGWIY